MERMQLSLNIILIAVLCSALSGVTAWFLSSNRSRKALDTAEQRCAQKEQETEFLQQRLQQQTVQIQGLTSDLQTSNSTRQHIEVQFGKVEVQRDEQVQRVHQSQELIKNLEQKLDALTSRHQSLQSEYAEVVARMEEREEYFQQQAQQLHTQKEAFSEQFKNLAQEILEVKSKDLQARTQESVSALMQPFKVSIDAFKKEVQDIHHRETSQQGELRKELQSLKELNQQITQEAHQLSVALKGQKKLQGNWGELVLENVLDRSGLQEGKDYKREVSFSTDDGRFRPDAIVYLPQGKHLVIDAKVSLNAYTRFVNAEDDISRTQALRDHVNAFVARLDELSRKDYWSLPGLNTPEIVFMFVPIESAFVEALKADETLFQRALENNVLVATPTTLLTSLNIVRQLWRYEDQNKHTAVLAAKAETVFKKLNTFLKSFEELKKGLAKANDAYASAEAQLLSGRGNLVKQVSEFRKLAPAIKQELPEYFTEKAELELDLISYDNNLENTEN